MKPNRLIFVSVVSLLFLLFVFSCAKNEGKLPPVAAINCDTISYAQDIAPIIAAKCSISGCHVQPNPPNGVMLNTYTDFRVQAENGNIYKLVIVGSPVVMPQTGQLPAEELMRINCWLNNGYKP